MVQRPAPHASLAPSVEGTAARTGWSDFERLHWGRAIVQQEATALTGLAERLNESFCRAIDAVLACRGDIVVSGIGKAGLVGAKISSTLCSTGTRSIFIHPAEAMHGDLGRLDSSDVVLMLSQSGETAEVVDLLPAIAKIGAAIISITKSFTSTLGQASEVVLELGHLEEAGPNKLAPSTSTTAMMAVGDALALVVSRLRGFGPEHFAQYHPGGSLGLKLAQVEDAMRPIDDCRVASDAHRVREVFVEASRPGRRSGAIMLQDEQGKLSGIFTDSDLARLLEYRQDSSLDAPIRGVMTASPTTVTLGTPLPEAVDLLASRKISELPVVDEHGRPAGMLDITDVVALLPHENVSTTSHSDTPNTIPFETG